MVVLLVVTHGEKCNNDDDPVEVVGKDRAVRGRVGPAKEGIEDAPTASAINFGVVTLRRMSALLGKRRKERTDV